MDNEHHRWNRQRAEHCLFFKGGMMDERLPNVDTFCFPPPPPPTRYMIIGLGFCVVLAYLWISIIL